jgi:hypothetical protein
VLPAAAVAVAAGANLVVEGAVDLVLLGAEDGGEEVGHFGWIWPGSVGVKCGMGIGGYACDGDAVADFVWCGGVRM